MKLYIRSAIAAATTSGLLFLSACSSVNGEFPSEDFELIIPYAAGGVSDTAGRVLAEGIEKASGHGVIVVNRPGGGAAVGLTEAAKAPADGYHLAMATSSGFATVPLLQEVAYSTDDFTVVGGVYQQSYVFVTTKDNPIQSLEDLANVAGGISYTTYALGHIAHLSMANTLEAMGVEGTPVPYDSAVDSLQAVTSGQVDVGVIDANVAIPQLQSGEITGLAVNSEERHPALPDIPSLTEAGYEDGAGFLSRLAIAAPVGIPDEVAEPLKEIMKEAYESDEFQEFMKTNYLLAPEYADSSFIDEYVPEERKRAEESFERIGIA